MVAKLPKGGFATEWYKEMDCMSKLSKAPLFIVSAVVLTASGPAWTDKPVEKWTEQDAKQILKSSPWVKKTTPAQLPNVSETQLRQGGRMGGGQGGGTPVNPATLLGIGGKTEPTRRRRRGPNPVEVRWESAAPIRAAERAAHEDDPPAWDGEMYAIAVYDIPGLDLDTKGLSADLKRGAYLKFGQKELRPVRVDLLPQEGDLTTIVFLFPRTLQITPEDKRIEFTTVFGRLFVTQYFYPAEMQFQGKLE